MSTHGRKQVRCAIYTRKSTEHGLELEFNSLHAQREACEAYIKSQTHEGWGALPTRYDDPAFSGGNLQRPALQRLLADIDRGKVDIVVVYKIDRLTRSLADFAKLVEIFDQKKISFVAITQQFNTTTSMGRLTLNVLLSFAQFERELSSERVRDKVAASRRKGKWTGGSVPLGYDAIDKKLVVNPAEAKVVRTIFNRYLALGTIQRLADDLKANKVVSKYRKRTKGGTSGGISLTYGALAHLLRNRIYLGEVGHKGKWFAGEHGAIIDPETFARVGQMLDANKIKRQLRRSESGALLTGLIFDDNGNRMSPSFATKRGIRYPFYVSTALLRGTGKVGSVGRVAATDIEPVMLREIRVVAPKEMHDLGARDLIARLVSKIVVSDGKLTIHMVEGTSDEALDHHDHCIKAQALTLDWTRTHRLNSASIDERASSSGGPAPDAALVQAIARAHYWLQQLSDGTHPTVEALAAATGMNSKVLRSEIRLAFLSPDLTARILDGTAGVTDRKTLLENSSLSWREQVGAALT